MSCKSLTFHNIFCVNEKIARRDFAASIGYQSVAEALEIRATELDCAITLSVKNTPKTSKRSLTINFYHNKEKMCIFDSENIDVIQLNTFSWLEV